ncbi:hypothetical protein JKF63_07751 [Porcisia hertigi]|uniref:Uncharacterized protein n=1 Tax=Porcisia hertigi TaxID=2761500 RepID=A0A836LLY3_9TRYP|nr:hypothetical protein JKF63_07751 [Porcisia hertigi]
MGSDTSNSHADFQSPQCRRYKGPDPLVGTTPPHQAASLPQQHQRHLEPSEGQVRFNDMVEILPCDPHATAHLNGTACVYGGNVKSNPATFTGGAVLAPSMAGRSANEDAEATESRQPRIPVAGDNEHVDGSALWSTQSPPSFVELVLRRIQTTSLLQFLWVLLLVVMLLVGNAFQVIFLNFWIHQFPTRLTRTSPSMSSSPASNESDGHGSEDGIKALASSYTTFVISAFVFPTFFLVLFIVYALWRRPNLGFTREWAGWRLLFGIGAMDALNSIMAIYAAANTPEVLQALFVSLVPIYSAVFTKWLLKDKRDYANPYVIVSFLLIATGVAIASLFNYAATHHHDMKGGPGAAGNRTAMKDSLFDFFLGGSSSRQTSSSPSVALDRRLWCFVFFLSVPPTVLMNVWQTMYMIRYTSNDQLTDCLADYANDEENEEGDDDAASISSVQSTRVLDDNADHHCDAAHRPSALAPVSTQTLAGSASGSLSSASAPTQHHPLHGEDTSVKLVMLTSDTAIQAIMALLLLPVDALPWFGGSDSIREVVQNLEEGIDCVLHCPHNMTFCILYSTGFVLVYIASAYLNRYSVTLCSMVSQLSGPITALILIAFPSLNMTGDASPWYVSIFAIIVLSCGTVVYVYWDEMTMEKKMEGEMQLKWDMVQEQQQHQHQRSHRPLQSSSGGPSYHEVDNGTHNTSPRSASQPQCPRHSRSRRYRRRPQSEYVVVFDQNVTNPADNGEPQRL